MQFFFDNNDVDDDDDDDNTDGGFCTFLVDLRTQKCGLSNLVLT